MLEFDDSSRGAKTKTVTAIDSAWGLVLGCLGYGIFLSWIWVVYYSNYPILHANMGPLNTSVLRIIMLIAIIAVLPLLGKAEGFFVTRRGIIVSMVSSIVLCPLGTVASLAIPCTCTDACSFLCMCPAMAVHAIAWALSGMGYAFFMTYWVWFLLALYRVRQRSLAIAATMVVSAVTFFLITLLQPIPSLVLNASIPAISVGLSVYSHQLLARSDSSIVIKTEGIKPDKGRRMRLSRKTVIMTMLSGILLGFCSFVITTSAIVDKVDSLLSIMLIVVGIVFLVMVKKRDAYDVDRLIWLYIPIAVLFLIPMSMVGDCPRMILACALIAVLTAYSFVDLNVFVNDMPFVVPHLTRVMAFGRMGNVCGLAIGWIMGLLLCHVLFDGQVMIQRVCLMLVMALIAWAPFMFCDLQSSASLTIVERPEADYYEAQCRKFAQIHDLTPRQLEVLKLLGRGRTAKSIQERLVVSESTAKSHIYNIYQKAGVHTQQELIDMLESLELTIDDFA